MYINNIQMVNNNIHFTKIEIRLIKFIFKHYKDKFNPREIARIIKLNHANINILCNSLHEKGLLKKEKLGNSIFYSFDYKNVLALNFIEFLLSLEEFPKWLAVLKYNLKQLEPYIEFGCIFGSAIKTSDFNDIDIFIIYDKKNIKNVNKIKNIIRKSEIIEKPIRYVEITKKDVIKNKDDLVFYNILSDNLIFYNPSKYIEVIKCLK